ncbi:hypothetical protein [Nitrosopumilus sp.]|uniref:hypothetical protein n=1 Tax=Nitrosopumilus sp. TaxID=2024843 RepID=UPI00292FDCF8|nr:hypothetical protein [Nitrosopumilus sp.]
MDNLFWIAPVLIGFFILLPNVHAETITQNLEGGMNVEITYPEEAIVGRHGIVSILVQNNGWEDKQDISFIFSSQDNTLITETSNSITIDKLSQGGSYGGNVEFLIPKETSSGIHFLNLKYSHILVANNETPQPAIFHDIAIPITIKDNVSVLISTKTPESIFANAEFPIEVELVPEDITISDVSIKIIPPKDIEFRGETLHTFSTIEKNTPIRITSQIITPNKEVNIEHKLPFEIIVGYTDDVGAEKTESQTVSVVLRPRTFMELTTDGGIWLGEFFIAPYVSLGTIIGIPAGALISLLIRRNQNAGKKHRKKKKI